MKRGRKNIGCFNPSGTPVEISLFGEGAQVGVTLLEFLNGVLRDADGGTHLAYSRKRRPVWLEGQ